jgi:hypothetical protein
MKKEKRIKKRIKALNINEFPDLIKRVESNSLQQKDRETIKEAVDIMEALLELKKRYDAK